jgi:hypothetical protein
LGFIALSFLLIKGQPAGTDLLFRSAKISKNHDFSQSILYQLNER